MVSTDQPGQPAIDRSTDAPTASPTTRPTGFRRTVLTAGMAAALLIAGGVAVVSAASPDPAAPSPAATASPAATTDPSTEDSTSGTAPGRGDCPDEDGDTDTSAASSSDT